MCGWRAAQTVLRREARGSDPGAAGSGQPVRLGPGLAEHRRGRSPPCARSGRRRRWRRRWAGRRRGRSTAGSPPCPGAASTIRRVASMPLMPGRLMSMRTSAGWRSAAMATASSPDAASADHVEAGATRSTTVRATARKGAWSSTISTLTSPVVAMSVDSPSLARRSGTTHHRPSASPDRPGWHPRRHGGASPPGVRPRPGRAGRP